MNLFYAKPEAVLGDSILIEGQESIHIVKVLRHKVGDAVYVTDGVGHRYDCTIKEVSKKSVSLFVENKVFIEPDDPSVSVAIGLIKKRDRLEFAVEKITELGAREIFIYVGDHSEKSSLRLDRIESSVISAMKQSLRYTLPKVHYYQSMANLLEKISGNGPIIVGDETEEEGSAVKAKNIAANSREFTLIIGPEGGFSEKERDLFKKVNASTCSLGSHRLRTETAAIVMTDRFINQS
jgi:16S rRNA (uracil1498-N3)-methyltransferase